MITMALRVLVDFPTRSKYFRYLATVTTGLPLESISIYLCFQLPVLPEPSIKSLPFGIYFCNL